MGCRLGLLACGVTQPCVGIGQLAIVVGEICVAGSQLLVVVLQFEDGGDAGEIDAVGKQGRDSTQSEKVVTAVSPRAAVGARGREHSATLVQTQGLRADSGQFHHHRDRVDATFGAVGRPDPA